ncbi:MAG: TatD family hydrolase [Bdellovibrionaceae bacterium]|nr:TatD family hydrolase [Pseudobdellovibrionaceae bacterium]
MLIDIHSHFDMLETSHEETIRLAQEAGVSRMITIGTEPPDFPIVLGIAEKYFPVVACTLGIHPHHGAVWTEEVGDFLNKHLPLPHVVAVGEIGLDYYYNQSPVDEQKLAFRRQLEISVQHKMPVQIHTRDAEADTVEILKDFKGQVTGVIHCFTGSAWLARQCLDLGLNISFSGIVTFKNAADLQATCKMVPLDRLHVETDSPFLTPVPLRGRKNTPAFVTHTADFVAKLHGISREELDRQTNENARQVFPKLKW